MHVLHVHGQTLSKLRRLLTRGSPVVYWLRSPPSERLALISISIVGSSNFHNKLSLASTHTGIAHPRALHNRHACAHFIGCMHTSFYNLRTRTYPPSLMYPTRRHAHITNVAILQVDCSVFAEGNWQGAHYR